MSGSVKTRRPGRPADLNETRPVRVFGTGSGVNTVRRKGIVIITIIIVDVPGTAVVIVIIFPRNLFRFPSAHRVIHDRLTPRHYNNVSYS